jgi:tetratricopeptide (TPR) repeat protein
VRRCLHGLTAARCATFGVAMLMTSTSAAESSVWRRAAEPARAESENTLGEARRLLERHALSIGKPAESERAWDALADARALLTRRLAKDTDRPELRLALARAERTEFSHRGDASHLEAAIRQLQPLMEAPRTLPPLLRASAWFDLAVCHAHLDERGNEIIAYERALELEPSPLHRSLVLANLADARMNRGDLAEAVRNYREALELLPSPVVPAVGTTTLWGLAVATDRSGDLPRALETVALARAYDPTDSQLRGPNWFFVPPREEHWYAALGHWARARESAEAATRRASYADAAESFRSYLKDAPSDDRWRPLAEAHERACMRESEGPANQAP